MKSLREIFNKMIVSFQPKASDGAPVTTTIEVVEGSARIVSENKVFYNPVQQFNRDLSLTVLKTFWKICQNESEQRKAGAKKIPGNDFTVSDYYLVHFKFQTIYKNWSDFRMVCVF